MTTIGGSSVCQRLLFEADAIFGSGVARWGPSLLRGYVLWALRARVPDERERERVQEAFLRCYRGSVDEEVARERFAAKRLHEREWRDLQRAEFPARREAVPVG